MADLIQRCEVEQLDEAEHRADLIGRGATMLEVREALRRAAWQAARAAWRVS